MAATIEHQQAEYERAKHELVVAVTDFLEAGTQAGKQPMELNVEFLAAFTAALAEAET